MADLISHFTRPLQISVDFETALYAPAFGRTSGSKPIAFLRLEQIGADFEIE